MKKIYTIQITDCIGRPNIWYADKYNRKYEATLVARPGTGEVVFKCTMGQYVHQVDCKVIGERLVEKYKKG